MDKRPYILDGIVIFKLYRVIIGTCWSRRTASSRNLFIGKRFMCGLIRSSGVLRIMVDEKMAQALSVLQQIAEDNGVPRNIRRSATDAMKVMQGKQYSNAVKASNAISILEDCSQDPNMPLFARTAIWKATSILEQIKD